MDGVIIFADNKVFQSGSFENQLFDGLRRTSSFSVLPICNIETLESTIKAISTFKALILDWNFDKEEQSEDGLDGIELPVSTPELFLDRNDLYSLIYVYSQNEIAEDVRKRFGERFKGKIKFRTKSSDNNIDTDVESIKQDIANFEIENKHMEIPFIWSHAINSSVQNIFLELEQANPNWIKEVRDTVKIDGGDSVSEVIDMFHHILNESLIQNNSLRQALDAYSCEEQYATGDDTAKLYRRIYYSRVTENAPIMTGDIFQFNENEYGILITPECDLTNKAKTTYDFLVVNKEVSVKFQSDKKKKHSRDNGSVDNIFNNGVISRHILVSFPFEDNKYDELAVIDFCVAMRVHNMEECDNMNVTRNYKLNSPYIQQLRQRYVAFLGRYGVPSIPQSLRNYHLK